MSYEIKKNKSAMATSNEDLIASDEMDKGEPIVSEDLNCPLCQKVFRSPRRLPCLHTFCQDCLQSHISNTVSVNGSVKEFCCPICGNKSRSKEEIPTEKWVLLFPLNTLMLSVLMKSKVKVDLVCNVCQVEDVTSPAEDLCIVCEEALCGNCSKVHRRSRLLTTHTILKIEEVPSKHDTVLHNHAVFHCTEHMHNPVELFCTNHEILLCTNCFFHSHQNCSNVVKLSNETPNISYSLMQMKEKMQNLEDQINKFIEINLSNLSKLETEVNELTAKIQALKKIINDALDDLEKRVKEEGNKMFNEEKKRTELLNHSCQSHVTAIRNSNVVMESASKNATQSQMFLLTKRIMNQISMSQQQIEGKHSQNNNVTFNLEINPQLESITKIPRGEIGRLKMKRNDEFAHFCDGFKVLKECKAESVNIKGVKVPEDMKPWFSGVTFTRDMQVLLVEYTNKTCYLLDSSYDIITSYTFSGKPWNVCIIGEKTVAITLPHEKSVHILSLQDNSITPIRLIRTQYQCFGIAAYNEEELIVSGPRDDGKKYYWSLITQDGKEKSYHEFDCEGRSQTSVALNALKNHLYISVYKDNSLHCFGLDGRKYFTFKHQDLQRPQGVAVDRDDNVYLLGGTNILQLSPNGSLIQIIVKDVKKVHMGICFDENRDKFVLTHFEDANLSVYVLNDKDG